MLRVSSLTIRCELKLCFSLHGSDLQHTATSTLCSEIFFFTDPWTVVKQAKRLERVNKDEGCRAGGRNASRGSGWRAERRRCRCLREVRRARRAEARRASFVLWNATASSGDPGLQDPTMPGSKVRQGRWAEHRKRETSVWSISLYLAP